MPRTSRFRRELGAAQRPRPARELLDAGITRDELRGPGWRRTSYGFYAPAQTGPVAGVGRRLDVPVEAQPTTTQRILDVAGLMQADSALTGSARRGTSATVRLLRGDPASAAVTRIEGIAVVDAFRATFDEMRLAASLEAAVVIADAVTHAC